MSEIFCRTEKKKEKAKCEQMISVVSRYFDLEIQKTNKIAQLRD
jgi:hypothetical protein